MKVIGKETSRLCKEFVNGIVVNHYVTCLSSKVNFLLKDFDFRCASISIIHLILYCELL